MILLLDLCQYVVVDATSLEVSCVSSTPSPHDGRYILLSPRHSYHPAFTATGMNLQSPTSATTSRKPQATTNAATRDLTPCTASPPATTILPVHPRASQPNRLCTKPRAAEPGQEANPVSSAEGAKVRESQTMASQSPVFDEIH